MRQIRFAQVGDKARIEKVHVGALVGTIDSQLATLAKDLSLCPPNSPEASYLAEIMKHPAHDLLIMGVQEMRDLVRRVDVLLPTGAFYRKTKKASAIQKRFTALNKELLKIFSYTNFSHEAPWCLGSLAQELVKTVKYCPYCNAETVYAYKIKVSHGQKGNAMSLKLVKSAFDHYFPKARYPFFAISLYNLIPACTRCNSGFKGDDASDLLKMAHPYAKLTGCRPPEDMHEGMKFDVVFCNSHCLSHCTENDMSSILLHERQKGTFPKGVLWDRTFRLTDSYTALYKADAALAIWRALAYSKGYLDGMMKQVQHAGLPRCDIERFLYGARLNEDDINCQRFGKMIVDLVETYRK